ncbi:beta-1,6-N-acetylglucosaminyltransferase [Pontibrevibacter nitratireducens]|uniref:Peptide O-xylosyltransferase n=2 Tax=Pontivivens nitratireducens TaxID=2758038 RepID=A0A6G7VIS7_9RHOB|nr:beta-1,6-N-acetylglucosaminyltransferase [Pontibrevibacter nitratireducens]
MVQIAYILLCHKNPDGVIAQARMLTEFGDRIAIHVDKSAPPEVWSTIRKELAGDPNVVFADRVKCGWGEWSLVVATLNALRIARKSWPDATHFYFISGDCMPAKSRAYIARFLEENDKDFVEHHDFFESDWIKTGIKKDRLHYRHYFNERTRKALFYGSLKLQRALGLQRGTPKGLTIHIGSQWCVLRRKTLDRVLNLIAQRRDIPKFFSTTWIPDETFFQTLVMYVTPRDQVVNRTLTFLAFSDYGLPLVFHDDHYDLIRTQPHLFARKVSENALNLRDHLRALYSQKFDRMVTADTAGALYAYVTQRGRIGRRYGERFWERGGKIGRDSEMLVVVCKKYHVGKRFMNAARRAGGPPAHGYVFDEDSGVLPQLGGIETSKPKRGRHRRAVLRMLLEYHGTDRLMICLDPSNFEALRDIRDDQCSLRVMELRTHIDDEYLLGHAKRAGLLPEEAQMADSIPLIRTLDRQFKDDSNALRDLGLTHLYALNPEDSADLAGEQIARFLDIPFGDGRDFAISELTFD